MHEPEPTADSRHYTCPTCGRGAALPDLTFGARLRLLRAAAGFTARQAAQRCGLPQTTYSLYESRAEFPDERTVRKLAAGFGVPVIALLGFPEPIASNATECDRETAVE